VALGSAFRPDGPSRCLGGSCVRCHRRPRRSGARLVNRLEVTALGCDWLLDRWGELRDLLEAGVKWQQPDRFKAIWLLGRQPLDI
jgi:hypothetical protein